MSLAKYFDYPSETANYLSNISYKYSYFYFANPKAASTGILKVLQYAEDTDRDFDAIESPHDRASSPLASFGSAEVEIEDVLRSGRFFKFTYVRNPFTRALSAYLDKIVNEDSERRRLLPELGFDADDRPTFLEFLNAVSRQRDDWRDIHWSTQTRLLQCNNIPYDYIGRFEAFERSFPQVLQRIGIDNTLAQKFSKPSHATGAALRIPEFIGTAEKDVIIAIYEADFRCFKYGYDPLASHI